MILPHTIYYLRPLLLVHSLQNKIISESADGIRFFLMSQDDVLGSLLVDCTSISFLFGKSLVACRVVTIFSNQ